jgi:hypothetical protein
MKDLVPWSRPRPSAHLEDRGMDEMRPLSTLRHEMDRLFEDAFRGWSDLSSVGGGQTWTLSTGTKTCA